MAAKVQFQTFPIMWPWGGITGTLAFFSNSLWTDQNEFVHLAGKGRALTTDAAQLVTIDIADRVGTVRSFEVEPTVLSIDNPHARITAVLFDSNDQQRKVLFKDWEWPATPNPMTWSDLTRHNHTRRRCLGDRYLTEAAILALLEGIPFSNPISIVGTSILEAGAATVLLEQITANSRVVLASQTVGVSGSLRVENLEIGVGFDIVSTNGLDAGEVFWSVFEL